MGKKSCDDSMVVTPSNNTLVNIGLTGIAIGVILNGIGISVTNEKLDDVIWGPALARRCEDKD